MARLACLAIFPVSRVRVRPPTSTVTRWGAGVCVFSDMNHFLWLRFRAEHLEARSQSKRAWSFTLTPTGSGPSMRKSKRRESSRGERNATDYTTRTSGTNSAGCLTTDSVWNVSIRENAVDTVLIPTESQDDYLRRLRRSTISRYRSGSRRLR